MIILLKFNYRIFIMIQVDMIILMNDDDEFTDEIDASYGEENINETEYEVHINVMQQENLKTESNKITLRDLIKFIT